MMSRLEIIDEGILYINPNPAYRNPAAFFPNIVQLSDQEFICLYQIGEGMYSIDSNIALQRSIDGGVTWRDEGILYDLSKDDRPWSYHSTFVSQMSDGTLVACPFRADRSDPAQPFFNDTGGLIAIEPLFLVSKDNGLSWTDPVPMALQEPLQSTPAQSIIELADGRWLAAFDLWTTFDDHRPYQPCMVTFASDDQGQTWKDRVVMADGAADGKGFWHGRPLRLSDDRLFSLLWSADMTEPAKGPVDLPIHYTCADASGIPVQTLPDGNGIRRSLQTFPAKPTAPPNCRTDDLPPYTPGAKRIRRALWSYHLTTADTPGISKIKFKCGMPLAGPTLA